MNTLEIPPVGVQIIPAGDTSRAHIERFQGVSYCQAVLEATFGRELIVEARSIAVCQWAPVVLGLKEAANEFERSIEKHLAAGAGSLYLAPIDRFTGKDPPDVVIVRARLEQFRKIAGILGDDAFVSYRDFSRDETALDVVAGGWKKGFSLWAIRSVNSALSCLNHISVWEKFTIFLFRSTTATRLLDRAITAFMANMSMCRNSTVIPLMTGKANISFFCTGGIAWGKNLPDFMTGGFPYDIYRRLDHVITSPGRAECDSSSAVVRAMKEMFEKTSTRQGGE